MPVRVAIWAAVSSKPQTTGDSLADQLRDGARFAADRGYAVTAALIVPGESRYFPTIAEMSASIKDTPENLEIIQAVVADAGLASLSMSKPMNAYMALQDMIAGHSIDILWCRDFDRLGRTDPLISEIQYRCRLAGVQLYVEKMPPTGRAVGDLYTSAFARAGVEHEIIRLRQRHADGFDTRVRRGLPVGSKIAFPYVREWAQSGHRLASLAVLVPEWRNAYHWIIEATLNRTHTAVEQCELLKTRVPELPWTERKLQDTLRSPFPLGLIVRQRQYHDSDDRQQRFAVVSPAAPGSLLVHPLWPEIEAILRSRIENQRLCVVGLGVHKPAVSPQAWVELQRFLAQRSEGRRPPSRDRLWSGLAYCGRCGAVMYAGSGEPYRRTGEYVCSQRKRWHACDNPYVQESAITDQVGAWLDNVAADERIAVAVADQELALPAPPNRDKELAELERRRERITALYETGRIELAEWDRRMAALDAAKAEIGSQIASVEDARQRLAQQRLQRQAMAEAAPVFRDRLAALDPAEANRWLRQLFRRVEIDNRIVVAVHV